MRFSTSRSARAGHAVGLKLAAAGITLIATLVLSLGPAASQSASGLFGSLSASQLEQLKAQAGSQSRGAGNQAPNTGPTVIQPAQQPSEQAQPPSRLERLMSARAGVRLKQIGYDQLGVGHAVSVPQTGAVQGSYVLGPGDEVDVVLRGQENAQYNVYVDRNGQISLPKLPPIAAAGRTLDEVRRDLLAAIHRAYVATEGYVSIGQLRQVSVMVSGEVANPGVRILTGLSTAADAIQLSGGVKKDGSLRRIYILRGNRRIPVDLYSLVTGVGQSSNINLMDGDRIVVPPLGPTVAVAGWVRRPGIYELAPGQSKVSARSLLSLAGGMLVRGKYRMSVMRVAADGTNEMVQLRNESSRMGDSDILLIQPAADQMASAATLSGGTALAGLYVAKNTKLSELLKSPGAMGQNPYTLFGVISRRDPKTLLRRLIAFTPTAVLADREDMKVLNGDIVRVLAVRESARLSRIVSLYDQRRQNVDEALQSVENPNGEYSGTIPSASSAETEEQSLIYVEREVATSARQARMQVDYGQMAPQRTMNNGGGQQLGASNSGTAANSQLNFQGQTGTSTNTLTSSGYGMVQNLPNLSSEGVQQQQQQQQQQIGPYRGEFSQKAPTLGQNLEQQSLEVGQVPTNQEVKNVSQVARQLKVAPIVLVNFLRDHTASVRGAVGKSGDYFTGPDADISSLLRAAGGLQRWANRSDVEVIATQVDPETGASHTKRRVLSLSDSAMAHFNVAPGDYVRVNKVFTKVGIGSAMVEGQVHDAGTFQITRGEHLSDLLMRAGGLTEDAYPYGTVFLRKSAARREQTAYRREAKEIENQLIMAMGRRNPNEKLSPDSFTALQGYISRLRNQKALGRVTVVADPAVLAAHPSKDPLIEPGDFVFVPPRPYSVSVLGEVLQPGSVPFNSNLTAEDYIHRAGGYSQFADEDATVVVLPDGSARPVDSSWLNFDSPSIPPGSTIYVGRDISGLDAHQIFLDSLKVVSEFATTAAALAVLSRNN